MDLPVAPGTGALASFIGDGGYDQDRVHDSVALKRT